MTAIVKVVRIKDGRLEERCLFPSEHGNQIVVWDSSNLRKDGQPNRTFAKMGTLVDKTTSHNEIHYGWSNLYALYVAEREAKAQDLRNTIHNLHEEIVKVEMRLLDLYREAAPATA